MSIRLTMAAAVWSVVSALAFAETDGPTLLARFAAGNPSSARTLFLYCETDLRGVYVWLDGQWIEAVPEEYTHEGKQFSAYRVSQRLVPADGRKLSVNCWTPAGDRTYRHELHLKSTGGEVVATAQLQSTRTREEYLADKRRIDEQRRKLFADPYGFIVLLNRYRASMSLRPVVHDPSLSRDAQVNNSMGSPHAYMGGAMVQNWAYGFTTAIGVLRGWQTSPGHNQNLLSPGITRVGIAESNAEWTFNGR